MRRRGSATVGFIIASVIAGIAPAHATDVYTFISIGASNFQLVPPGPGETPPLTRATVDSTFFTFDNDRLYDNVAYFTSVFGDFNGPVSFSYDPSVNRFALGTTTSPQGCVGAALANDGLCVEGVIGRSQGIIDKFYYRTQTGDLYLSTDIINGIPEPSTWALMIAGLGGVGAVMRGRRRAVTAHA